MSWSPDIFPFNSSNTASFQGLATNASFPGIPATPISTDSRKEWLEFRKLFAPILFSDIGSGMKNFKLNINIGPGRIPLYNAEIEFYRMAEKRRAF